MSFKTPSQHSATTVCSPDVRLVYRSNKYKISFTESCEWFEGGFALVCRSEGQGPMGPSKSLSIMTYDAGKKAYTYYGLESNAPPFMAIGQRQGKDWRWGSEAKMGEKSMKTRVTITEISPSSYGFEMEMSTDGGTWTRAMGGKSTKKTT